MGIDYINLNTFLDFGYFLKYPNVKDLVDFSLIDRKKYDSASELELVSIGAELWQGAIDHLYEPGAENCVPLSGGLDSRALLSGLLQCTESRNIHTYTFGIPGAWDYEIGKLVARKIGTKHTQINMNEYIYSQNELIEVSKRIDRQTMLFLHPPLHILERFQQMNVWTGAVIDVLFGRHHHSKIGSSFEEAAINSFKENMYVKSVKLSNLEHSSYVPYVKKLAVGTNWLAHEHEIDLLNRQAKYIWPHVCMKGFHYKTVLSNMELVTFALSVDQKHHFRQNLYRKMFMSQYAEYFSYPTKSNQGFPLNTSPIIVNIAKKTHSLLRRAGLSRRHVNYMDFNKAIRSNISLRRIVSDNIQDLAARKVIPWVDPVNLFTKHISKHGNFADALLVLVSLEIHMKNGRGI